MATSVAPVAVMSGKRLLESPELQIAVRAPLPPVEGDHDRTFGEQVGEHDLIAHGVASA